MHQKCFNYALTNLLFGLCRSVWVIEVLVNLPSPILELQHTPPPLKCYKSGSMPQLPTLSLFSSKTNIWIYWGGWECIRNSFTKMHICYHVFTVPKHNLLAKHPTFTLFMDEYYYIRMQNWTKNDDPLNESPIPLGRDFFLLNSIECPPITKNFWKYYI